ncbi:MAG: ORF6N domain-containing protein [Patescibacteria group bacterium]|nr:ORF6N domain-containing protein [Patescibacteria group bacterium]
MYTGSKETSLVLAATPEFIGRRIYIIRGKKVMMDSDLAELYQIQTKTLNRAVQRNIDRFPSDFSFRLTAQESESLRYQIGTSKIGRGGRRNLPYVFTELGVAMLSSVLNSDRAIQMNIFIMRAFVKLRELLATNKDLAKRVGSLEKRMKEQGKNLADINAAVNKLITLNTPTHDAIGFEI